MRRPLSELRDQNAAIKQATATLRQAVRRLTPAVIGEAASAKVARMLEHEGFRYAPEPHKTATRNTVFDEITRNRETAAGVALFEVQKLLPAFSQDVIDTEQATRRNVALTWPHAYDRLDNSGMVGVGIYRELRRQTIDQAGPSDLSDWYEQAIEDRQLATSIIDAELIEARLDSQGAVATVEKDVPLVKALRDRIDG